MGNITGGCIHTVNFAKAYLQPPIILFLEPVSGRGDVFCVGTYSLKSKLLSKSML